MGVQRPGVEEARWPGVCKGDAGAGPRAQSAASVGLEATGLGEAWIWGRGCVSSMGS